jgi:hypothetical protein
MTLEQFEQARKLVPDIQNLDREIQMLEEDHYTFTMWIGNSIRTIPDDLKLKFYQVILDYNKDIRDELQKKLSQI